MNKFPNSAATPRETACEEAQWTLPVPDPMFLPSFRAVSYRLRLAFLPPIILKQNLQQHLLHRYHLLYLRRSPSATRLRCAAGGSVAGVSHIHNFLHFFFTKNASNSRRRDPSPSIPALLDGVLTSGLGLASANERIAWILKRECREVNQGGGADGDLQKICFRG